MIIVLLLLLLLLLLFVSNITITTTITSCYYYYYCYKSLKLPAAWGGGQWSFAEALQELREVLHTRKNSSSPV